MKQLSFSEIDFKLRHDLNLHLLSARRHSMLGYIFDSRTVDIFET
jgi:hypothetical protein